MTKTRDDRKALDAFIQAHSYPAKHGLIVKKLISHPVHARGDRGNAAAYFRFPGLKALEAHISELQKDRLRGCTGILAKRFFTY